MRRIAAIASIAVASLFSVPSVTAAQSQAPPSKDIEIEVTPVPRAAAPAATLKLLYTIYNYEDSDVRVRVRLDRTGGWQPVDADLEERELLVPSWDNVEGELFVTVPADVRPGQRSVVRLLTQISGDDGAAEARNVVSIAARGGVKPGVKTFTATTTFGATGLRGGDLGAPHRSEGLTLSSKLGPKDSFSLSYDRGLRDALSNFRYEEDRTRVAGNARFAGWEVTFGNSVSSPGHALSGPYVRGRGAAVRRTSGALVAELIAAQPTVLQGRSQGHVWRALGGLRSSRASFAVSMADFGRPGGYTSLARVQTTVLDPETQARQDYERRLTATTTSNRVRALGVEGQLTPNHVHTVSLRTGELWLANTSGIETRNPVGEASYALVTARIGMNARWRHMPATLPGIFLPGNDLGADGHVRLAKDVHAIGSVSTYSTSTFGASLAANGQSTSIGVRAIGRGKFVEIRGNVRESDYGTASTRHTVSATASMSKGAWALTTNNDVGSERVAGRSAFNVFAMASVRWTRDGNTWSLTMTHSDTAGVRRERADLLLSTKVRWAELAGGAWVTRGYTFGGQPGSWVSIGVPAGAETILTVGLDYTLLTWTSPSSLRGVVSIRKRFTAPIPFVPVAQKGP